MRFVVRHETVYRYSVPVQLAAHWVRLSPRLDSVRLASQALDVEPQPAARFERIDPFGNRVTELGFAGSTQQLRIVNRLELDTIAPPPLAALSAALPLIAANDGLAVYRDDPTLDPSVVQFAEQLAQAVGREPLAFLDRLTATLFGRTDPQSRLSGDAQPAAATLASGQGSCRDLTVLFVAACRAQGLASRFTSGYLAPADTRDLPRELHAWAEVFLPGQGFTGFDPALGRRASTAHVPLCAAPTQTATMPVEGGYFFQGAAVTTTLDFDLRIAVSS